VSRARVSWDTERGRTRRKVVVESEKIGSRAAHEGSALRVLKS
jgi:hypothetical protein